MSRQFVRRVCRRITGLLLLLLVTSAFAQSSVIDREYDIKAMYLYHFSRYVEWPADAFPTPGKPFVIGVFETNPFGTTLDRIAHKKKVDDRAIEIRLVTSVEEAWQCQILFIPASVPLQAQNLAIQATMRHPVLLIGESEDFVARGGNVQFYLEGNKVRFAFGAEAIKRDDLKVSSKLLTLAKIIPSR